MSKIIKRLLLTIIIIVLLPVVALAVAMAVIDPNDYKGDIEAAVAQNSNAELKIAGNLGWSLLPLGIDINKVSVFTADQQTFTDLEKLTAEVDLWSLFQLQPKVHRLLLDGLTVHLKKNAQGEANWATLTKTEDSATPADKETTDTDKTPAPSDTGDTAGSKKELSFDIAEVAITNTTVHYDDLQNEQSVVLKGFDLLASDITLNKAFPLLIKFAVSNQSPQVDLAASLRTHIFMASDFKVMKLSDIDLAMSVKGEPVNQKTIKLGLQGHAGVDLNNNTAQIENLILKAANLQLNASLKARNLDTTPAFDGSIQIAEFSLQQLLDQFGLDPIDTSDKNVLQKLGLGLSLSGTPAQIKLSDINIKLDDTRFTGAGEFAGEPLTAKLKLSGTALDADRYLPAPPTELEQLQQATEGSSTPADKPAAEPSVPETPLLPVELIRNLVLDIHIQQEQLKAKNLTVKNIQLDLTGKDGVINLEQLRAELYEGFVKASAKIDARKGSTDGEAVTWDIRKEVTNIQTLPLLTDFGDIKMVSGGINANVQVNTKGNLISVLRAAAQGTADFNFDKGAFHGFNMTALACQGVAMINRESVDTSKWPEATPFQDLSGQLKINGNELNNSKLVASLSGLALSGNGVIDLEKQALDYRIALNVVGDLGDNACRVQERVKKVPIPVRCQGGFNAPNCGLDTERLSDVIETMAKEEAKRKAKKELDKQVDKQLDKFLKEDDSSTKKEIKKLLKGFF